MKRIFLAMLLAGLGAAAFGGSADWLRHCMEAKKVPAARELDVNALAERLSGASQSEIEATVDTVALLAAYKHKAEVSMEDMLDAIDQREASAAGVSVKEFRALKKRLNQPAAKAVSKEMRDKAEDVFKFWE